MAKKSKKNDNIAAGYDYGTLKVRARDGTLVTSPGNADAVARAMLLHLAVGGGTVNQVIAANGLKVKKGGNDGLVRMAVGNALRGLVRNGTPVRIGKLTVKTLKQPVALPKVEAAKTARGAGKKAAKKIKAKRKAPRTRAPEAQLLADGGAPL